MGLKKIQLTLIRLVAVPSGLCVVCVCVNASVNVHNLGVAFVRLSEAVVCSQALLTWRMWGWVCPAAGDFFDLYHAPPTLTLAHPNPVNELEDLGAIRGQCPAGGEPTCV